MKKIFIILIGFLCVSTASAEMPYKHKRSSSLEEAYAEMKNWFADPELTKYKYLIGNGREFFDPDMQLVGCSHKGVNEIHPTPTAKRFAYTYGVSFKDKDGSLKHRWFSNIYQEKGEFLQTEVVVPFSHKRLPKYNGKTYENCESWFRDKLFNDSEVNSKYKDLNNVKIIDYRQEEILNENQYVIGSKKVPIYEYVYLGTIKIGGVKKHGWIKYGGQVEKKPYIVYTLNPHPPRTDVDYSGNYF